MRDILETEPPPLPADDRPDSRTHRSSAVDSSRGGSASHADFSDGTLLDDLHLRDRREEERFLPTQAAIASTPRRSGVVSPIRDATPVGAGGFDLYERGVDAVHVATARWSPATSVSMHRSPSPAARRSPYSPAFAAGLRAASAPPRDRPATHHPATHRPATHRESSSVSFRARDDAEAAYVARIRGARSNPRRKPPGGEGGSDSFARGPGPAWGAGPGASSRPSTAGRSRDGRVTASGARRLFDPDAKARAERAAAVAAAAECKAVERMAAARSKRNTTGGQSGGAAWQPPRDDSNRRRRPPFGVTLTPPERDRSLPSRAGNTERSPGSKVRWEPSEKVEDRLRRDWVLREARRESSHAERVEVERAEREDERRRANPHAVRHPTNASPARLAAHGRRLHARGEQRRARIESAHSNASPAQLSSPPVGMGGEESVAFRGMTNVSRALMEDRREGFLQRQSSALARRDAKMEEERRAKEAEEAAKDAAAMRSTPEITKTASAMRRTVDDLRAWQDRKNASVRELRRRKYEYEDRVHNTFAPRMSKGSVAIDRERRNAAAKYRSARSATSSPGAEPSPSRSNDELHREHDRSFDDETSAGAAGARTREVDAFSPEPRVRNLRTAPTPTPMTRRASSTDGGGADAMAAVLAGAAMAGAAALAARTTGRGAAKPEAAAAGAKPAGGEAATGMTSIRNSRSSVGTSIRNSVRVPRAAAGHYTRNPAAVTPVAMTLDDEKSSTFAPRITAKAASLRRFGDFGDRMHKAAVEAANEKASASPGGTKRRGPRGVGAGARSSGVDSNRGWTRGDWNREPSDWNRGPAGDATEWGPPVVSVGTPRARRRSSSVLKALARRKSAGSRSTPESSPGLRGRSRATKRINRRVSDAAATEGEGEYWTAAGEDSAGEFGDLGTDPDAFVATARRGRETDAAWGHAMLREGA